MKNIRLKQIMTVIMLLFCAITSQAQVGGSFFFSSGGTTANITALNCSSATHNGTLYKSTAASGVNSVIAYTGGDGSAYTSQTLTSTGITGLTASVAAGNFASGNGNLTYTISGTPSGDGLANFAISIGGQSCTLMRTVFLNFNTVTNPVTGRVWMDRNLGATQVATSSTDASSYGDLYQWGRVADGHQRRTSAKTTTLSTTDLPGNSNFITTSTSPNDWRSPQNDNLWQGVNGTNNPCPTGYRLPTSTEWDAEIATWSSPDDVGAFGSVLKLPLSGYRSHNTLASLGFSGLDAFYWSSTVDSIIARSVELTDPTFALSMDRAYGMAVRCIKN